MDRTEDVWIPLVDEARKRFRDFARRQLAS
jgi:hypothetical protein